MSLDKCDKDGVVLQIGDIVELTVEYAISEGHSGTKKLNKGDKVRITELQGKFCRVEHVDGTPVGQQISVENIKKVG